jgi:hypothetical protein
MSARLRLSLTTALVVMLALVAFETVFYLQVLTDGDPNDNYLIAARGPSALVLGVGGWSGCAACGLAGRPGAVRHDLDRLSCC